MLIHCNDFWIEIAILNEYIKTLRLMSVWRSQNPCLQMVEGRIASSDNGDFILMGLKIIKTIPPYILLCFLLWKQMQQNGQLIKKINFSLFYKLWIPFSSFWHLTKDFLLSHSVALSIIHRKERNKSAWIILPFLIKLLWWLPHNVPVQHELLYKVPISTY